MIVYTSSDPPELIREAARADAVGMVRKSENPGLIVETVRMMLRGKVVASADWAAAGLVIPQLTLLHDMSLFSGPLR